jgi:hypothetical protein
MAEITISYIQKNGSTNLGKEVIQADFLPRVGELIYHPIKFHRTRGEGHIICTAHEVVNNKMKHHIVAREGHYSGANDIAEFNHYELMKFIDFNKTN